MALSVSIGSGILFSWSTCAAELTNALIQKVWGEPRNGFATSISTDKTNYTRGELIKIRISIKNFGTNVINTLVMDPTSIYGVGVMDTNGEVFCKIDPPEILTGFSTMQIWLKPGEEYAFPSTLIYPLQINQPGIYRVKLFGRHQQGDTSFGVSNGVEILITQDRFHGYSPQK
jgi:hypothetical protein